MTIRDYDNLKWVGIVGLCTECYVLARFVTKTKDRMVLMDSYYKSSINIIIFSIVARSLRGVPALKGSLMSRFSLAHIRVSFLPCVRVLERKALYKCQSNDER